MINLVCEEINLLIQAWIVKALFFEFLPEVLETRRRSKGLLLMTIFVCFHIKYLPADGLGLLCMTMILIFIMPFFFSVDRKQQMSWPVLAMALNFLSAKGAILLYHGIGRDRTAYLSSSAEVVRIAESMFFAAMIMCIYAGIDFLIRKVRYWELTLLVVVPLYQVILMVSYFRICTEIHEREVILGSSLLILSVVIDNLLVRNMNNLIQTAILQEEIRKLYLQREGERDYYRLNESYERQIREMEEKFAGQMKAVKQMLESGEDLRKVRLSLNNAFQSIQASKGIRYCDNSVVNSVLVLKKKLAEKKGIPMSIHAYITDETGIEALDLCSLFCNLIDNAIEACERITDPYVNKKIAVASECKAGYLFLKVINSTDKPAKKMEGRYQTSKPEDRMEHGIGLRLVEKIVDLYEGKLQILEEKGQFSVMAVVKMKEGKNDE